MAWIFGGKHFGQYTYEHWFDHEYKRQKENKVSKTKTALQFFENYNCAQAVLSAYAGDYGLDGGTALRAAVGFGGGIGRLQEICGAVSGAVIVLGLASGFREGDSREKINAAYAKVRDFVGEFTSRKGTVKCRDLLGCDLSSEEGQAFFKEHDLRNTCCRECIALACELVDKYLAE